MKRLNRIDTRLEIIRTATELFLEQGFDATTVSMISKKIGISTGNLTFYFPKKETLLVTPVKELCDFQWKMMKQSVGEGETLLMAYCLEITAIAACCDEDPKAKSFYSAAYSHSETLAMIQENDTEKAKDVFKKYRPDWSDERFEQAENIVSGIEFATLFTPNERTALGIRVEGALNTILSLYGISKELRRETVKKVLSMDYRKIGREMFLEFIGYANRVNDKALTEAAEKAKEKRA